MVPLATLPRIALLTSSVGIELLSSSARIASVKFAHGVVVSDISTHRSDPKGQLGPIKITSASQCKSILTWVLYNMFCCVFLATLVAIHSTPVSQSLCWSAEFELLKFEACELVVCHVSWNG